MGKMLCEKHGSGELVQACPHFAEQISSKNPLVGYRLNTLPPLYVCDECFASLGLETFGKFPPFSINEDSALTDRRFEVGDLIPEKACFCSKCVAELDHSHVQGHSRSE
jgi:hypothetical protein